MLQVVGLVLRSHEKVRLAWVLFSFQDGRGAGMILGSKGIFVFLPRMGSCQFLFIYPTGISCRSACQAKQQLREEGGDKGYICSNLKGAFMQAQAWTQTVTQPETDNVLFQWLECRSQQIHWTLPFELPVREHERPMQFIPESLQIKGNLVTHLTSQFYEPHSLLSKFERGIMLHMLQQKMKMFLNQLTMHEQGCKRSGVLKVGMFPWE